MEQLIKLVTEKAGISPEQAKTAVATVTNFLKDKLPAGIQGQFDSVLSGGAGMAGNLADNVKDKVGGVFGNK